MLRVRTAEPADVLEMSRVLIASITELCAADHGNDPGRIADWTANKTPDGVGAMLARAGQTLFVAERDGAIAAVGQVRGDTIGLNYVDPQHRCAGVSRALLAHMEACLRGEGVTVARLVSTATARAFYNGAGWRETAPGAPGDGYPMEKLL